MAILTPEKLLHKGEVLKLFTAPLGPFFKTTRSKIKMSSPSRALARGYVGSWSIEQGRLYFIEVNGEMVLPNQERCIKLGLKDIFPDATDAVFAHWFTGDLRCAMGEMLTDGVYEEDLFIRIKRGVVQEEHTVSNVAAAKPH